MQPAIQQISIDEFVRSLREKGVLLRIDGNNNLDIDAPVGVLEKAFVEEIRSRKPQLIAYFKNVAFDEENNGSITLAPEAPYYTLSPSQMNVWTINELWGDSPIYNIDSLTVWSAGFDVGKFEKAIQLAIERHEILRTIFKEDEEGIVKQWVLPFDNMNFKVMYVDMRPDEERYQQLQVCLKKGAD
jgi:hypothetical protein